jgi:uncharacterized membrane protein
MKSEMIVVAFDQMDTADEALQAVKRCSRAGAFATLDAAVLIKDHTGRVSIRETQDVSFSDGALFGAVSGGLLGLMWGPNGAIAGTLIGATIGGLAGGLVDTGLPNTSFRDIQRDLPPSSSALVTVVEARWAHRVVEALAEFQGRHCPPATAKC